MTPPGPQQPSLDVKNGPATLSSPTSTSTDSPVLRESDGRMLGEGGDAGMSLQKEQAAKATGNGCASHVTGAQDSS